MVELNTKKRIENIEYFRFIKTINGVREWTCDFLLEWTSERFKNRGIEYLIPNLHKFYQYLLLSGITKVEYSIKLFQIITNKYFT